MTMAMIAVKAGGPEVLEWTQIDLANPQGSQVRIKQTAIGVNFIDTYHRTGRYPGMDFPSVIGVEAAGIVTGVGESVTHISEGDRVCYALARGSYAEERLIDQSILVPIPEGVTDEEAAAGITKGVTVQHLFTQARHIQKDDYVLFHAAAGGVGLLACQWAKHLGAKLIGTVSNTKKAKLAQEYGAQWVIDYTQEDFVKRVNEITSGAGVVAVFDGIGGDNPKKSAKCLATFGTLCTFGAASGPSTLIIDDLPASAQYTKGSIATLITLPEMYRSAAVEFFKLVEAGNLKINIGQTYALKDAAQAHLDLESRKTVGSIILKP